MPASSSTAGVIVKALLPERFAAPEGKPPVQLTFALMNTVLSEETAALHD